MIIADVAQPVERRLAMAKAGSSTLPVGFPRAGCHPRTLSRSWVWDAAYRHPLVGLCRRHGFDVAEAGQEKRAAAPAGRVIKRANTNWRLHTSAARSFPSWLRRGRAAYRDLRIGARSAAMPPCCAEGQLWGLGQAERPSISLRRGHDGRVGSTVGAPASRPCVDKKRWLRSEKAWHGPVSDGTGFDSRRRLSAPADHPDQGDGTSAGAA